MADVVCSLCIKVYFQTPLQLKEECREIARIVEISSAILMRMEFTDDKVLRSLLEDAAASLEEAAMLVSQCQRSNGIRLFFAARDMAKALRRVKEDITSKMMIVSFATSIQGTKVMMERLQHTSVQSPQKQDPVVADPSNIDQPTDDNRSEIEEEEKENNLQEENVVYFSEPNFTFSDLVAAFKKREIIAPSPCSVYKGALPQGGGDIAIKCHERIFEFSEERAIDGLKHISKLNHQNILKILGCAHRKVPRRPENDQLEEESYYYHFFVVQEKMSGKSLQQLIDGSCGAYNWNNSFPVIEGIANGLHYLHNNRVVHSNLKPSNILIDSEHKQPKICDFGVAGVLDHGDPLTSRYSAPEFYKNEGILTTMSDVYAFGLILLETIRGMCEPVPNDPKADPKATVKWALDVRKARVVNFSRKRPRRLGELFNSSETTKNNLREIKWCMKIGLLCTHEKPDDRPNMSDVVRMLEEIRSDKPKMLKSFPSRKRS